MTGPGSAGAVLDVTVPMAGAGWQQLRPSPTDTEALRTALVRLKWTAVPSPADHCPVESSDESAEATAVRMRALSHPSRVRLWVELGGGEATISQLSNKLAMNKGSVSHHLAGLVAGGLVRESRTRTVRGGTERYFERIVERIQFGGPGTPADQQEAAGAMMQTVVDALGASPAPRVHHRTVALSPEQARSLAAHFDEVIHSLAPADPPHRRYGILTAVYRTG